MKTSGKLQVQVDIGYKGSKQTLLYKYKKHFNLFLLFVPVLIYLLIFCYTPMLGIVIAFKDYNLKAGIWGSPWVGLKYFRQLFSTPSFFEVLRNTIWISCLRILFGFPAPIILALLLNEVLSKRYKKVVQTVSYLPHFLSWVILAGIFIPFLSPASGPVSYIFKVFGLKPVYFLGDPKWFVFTLIITGIWQSCGWGSIIYLAAISNISMEQYESSFLDGANRLQRAIYITIPSILPAITIIFILNVGSILNGGFDQIFNLYNEGVYKVADIIDTYVYRRGLIKLEYSYSTAVNLFKSVIGFFMVLLTNQFTKKVSDYSLW